MRDFFIYPAQTNVELYAQAIARGYSRMECHRLGAAYLFALRQVFPLARGSGKPFIAHLVGTASLVLESGCPEDWVIGALLHALYQQRIPFHGGALSEDRRRLVVARFGAAVDDLVHGYTAAESWNLRHCSDEFVAAERDVLTLRLADELEDLSGHALALHGTPFADDSAVGGGYVARRNAKMDEAPALIGLAQRLELVGIGRGLGHWLDFSTCPEGLTAMRTGWLSSVNLANAD